MARSAGSRCCLRSSFAHPTSHLLPTQDETWVLDASCCVLLSGLDCLHQSSIRRLRFSASFVYARGLSASATTRIRQSLPFASPASTFAIVSWSQRPVWPLRRLPARLSYRGGDAEAHLLWENGFITSWMLHPVRLGWSHAASINGRGGAVDTSIRLDLRTRAASVGRKRQTPADALVPKKHSRGYRLNRRSDVGYEPRTTSDLSVWTFDLGLTDWENISKAATGGVEGINKKKSLGENKANGWRRAAVPGSAPGAHTPASGSRAQERSPIRRHRLPRFFLIPAVGQY